MPVISTLQELIPRTNALELEGKHLEATNLVRIFIDLYGSSLTADDNSTVVALLSQLEERHSRQSEASWLERCRHYRERGEPDKALDYLKLILERNPTSADAQQELRMVARANPDRREKARDLLRQVGGDERMLDEPSTASTAGGKPGLIADEDEALRSQLLQATRFYRLRHHGDAIAILDRLLSKAKADSAVYDQSRELRSKAYNRLEAGEQPLDTLPYEAVSEESQSTSAMRVGLYDDAEKHIAKAIEVCREQNVSWPEEWSRKLEHVHTLQMAQKQSLAAEQLLRKNRVNDARDALQKAKEVDFAFEQRYEILVDAIRIIQQGIIARLPLPNSAFSDELQKVEGDLDRLSQAIVEFGHPNCFTRAASTFGTQLGAFAGELRGQASSSWSLEERSHLLSYATTILELACNLCPNNALLGSQKIEVAGEFQRTSQNWRILTEVRKGLSQCTVETPATSGSPSSEQQEGGPQAQPATADLNKTADLMVQLSPLVAVQEYQHALSDIFDRLFQQVRAAVELCDWSRAEQQLRMARRLLLYVFGEANSHSAENDAVKHIRERLTQALDTIDADLKYDKARERILKQDYEGAVDLYEQLLAVQPEQQRIKVEYANVMQRHQRANDVRRLLIKGVACLEAGSGVEAVEALTAALNLAPDDIEVQELLKRAEKLKQQQQHGWAVLSAGERAAMIGQLALAALLTSIFIFLLVRIF